jgi:hypothetical protein
MSVGARKRLRLAPALTWVALAAPVVAGGYIVYQKHQALSVAAGTNAGTPTQPRAAERVYIVATDEPQPLLRDPGRRSDPDPGAERPAAAEAGQPAKKRVINLGPSPHPEQRSESMVAAAPPPPPAPATPAGSGPKFYQAAPTSAAPAGPTDPRRRRAGVVAESDPSQVIGSSLSVGPGQISSGSNP